MKLILPTLLAGLLLLAPTAFGQAPANDNLADRIVLTTVLPTSEFGTTVGATSEAGEPAHAPGFGNLASNSVWYAYQATANSRITVTLFDTAFDSTMGAYIAGPADPTMADLNEVSNADLLIAGGDETMTFDVIKDETYYIAVDGFSTAEGVTQDSGSFTLNIIEIIPADPPPNDNLADRTVLSGVLPINEPATTAGATAEIGEADHANLPDIPAASNMASNSVWFAWTSTFSGEVSITELFSDYDSVLSVYTAAVADPTHGDLSLFAESDQFFGGDEGVTFNAVKDETYYVAVDGYAGVRNATEVEGPFTLEIAAFIPTLNDSFADAIDLSGQAFPLTVIGTTENSSAEVGEPAHSPNAGNVATNSVWYCWTAPSSGDLTITVENVVFDPVLAVYTGDSVDLLNEIAGADAGAGGGAETVTFAAISGTKYFIAVDVYSTGAGGPGGVFDLVLSGDFGAGGGPFATWIAGFPSLSGADAARDGNPSGDGISNLMKLVLGLNPTIPLLEDPNRGNFPVLTTSGNNPAIQYTVDPANLGTGGSMIQHGGEVSNDLGAWNSVGALNIGGNTWLLEIQSVGADRRYGRITASDPADD